jgi:hypothetical protein
MQIDDSLGEEWDREGEEGKGRRREWKMGRYIMYLYLLFLCVMPR